MKAWILGFGLLACLGVGGILGLRYQARQERIAWLAHHWSEGELAIGLINCRASSELYLGVPCDEILEAYALRPAKKAAFGG